MQDATEELASNSESDAPFKFTCTKQAIDKRISNLTVVLQNEIQVQSLC